jgi:hypothetical protein
MEEVGRAGEPPRIGPEGGRREEDEVTRVRREQSRQS